MGISVPTRGGIREVEGVLNMKGVGDTNKKLQKVRSGTPLPPSIERGENQYHFPQTKSDKNRRSRPSLGGGGANQLILKEGARCGVGEKTSLSE